MDEEKRRMCSCGKNYAHPLYNGYCEDCYVNKNFITKGSVTRTTPLVNFSLDSDKKWNFGRSSKKED